ncbi:hypothetical protein [Pontibacter litorisediminis]|uniref:hypothetical protein n=1 Tax=Pontibacter litorisediminis TaxID=1846260 RepID=UPI0023ECFC19|nr:hypothetical protein [Pontibacter litorisediminis]
MHANNNKKSAKTIKWLKAGAWVLGLALLLFISLFFFTVWLENKVERMVSEQSKGIYKLQLYGLTTSPFIGSLSVDSLRLQPDYKKWKQLMQQGQEVPRTLLDLHAGAIHLRNLSYAKALFKQQVQLEEMEVLEPKLLLSNMRADTTETHKPLHETAKGFIQGLGIGKIDVRQASLYYRDGPKGDTLLSVRRFRLAVDDFQLDSASYNAKDRAYYAHNYTLEAKDAAYLLPQEYYRFSSDSLYTSTKKGEVLVQQIKLQPILSPAELARAKGEAVTHQEVEVEQLTLRNVAFGEHSRTNKLHVGHVLLQTPALNAFKDKQNFQDKSNKELPHQLVQRIKTPFLIDSVELKNGYIRYAELVPKAQERGHITFHQLNAIITNVSNIPEQISVDKPAVVQASSMVMDRAKLQVTIRLPLLHENCYHSIEGEIGPANLQMLNPILIPTAFVELESGEVRSGRFRAELNETRASGEMTLLYNNLKVELLSKGTGGEQSFGKEVLSVLANKIAIKESNPGEGEKPRTGEITVTRDPKKSVFNYWKECLSSGFLSSMGLNGMAEK